MGPEHVLTEEMGSVVVCPLCGCELTSHHSLKNGGWTLEPVSNFGITDRELGMVCAEWDEGRLWFYYHSPKAVEQGELK